MLAPIRVGMRKCLSPIAQGREKRNLRLEFGKKKPQLKDSQIFLECFCEAKE